MSLSFRAHAALLGAAFSTIAHAGVLDQPTVRRFVAGWQARDGAQVLSAFATGGEYRDPGSTHALTGPAIAAHVDSHRDARFELIDANETAEGSVRLNWKIVWADRRGESRYVDVLNLKDGAILSADSSATADTAANKLVADYLTFHDNPTREGIAALFTPDFVVHGPKSDPAGRRGDQYLQFLQSLKGTSFTQDAGSPVLLTKDHRLVLFWTVRKGTARLAGGVDYLTVEGRRISKIVGVY